jgi:HlyD family secretion protein
MDIIQSNQSEATADSARKESLLPLQETNGSLPATVDLSQSSLRQDVESIPEEQVHFLGEDEFLPSLSPWLTFFSLGSVVLFNVALLLASVLKFNNTVKTPAVLRPVGELKVAQSNMEGVIERIYVQENQAVRKGDVVAHLDDSQLRSKLSQLSADMQRATMQVLQIESQITGINNQIIAEKNVMDRAVAAAAANVLEQQDNYENLRVSTLADYQEASSNLRLATQERQSYRQLEVNGGVPRLTVRLKETAVQVASAKFSKLKALLHPSTAQIVRAKALVIQEEGRGEATIAGLKQQLDQFLQNQNEALNQKRRLDLEIKEAKKQLQYSVVRAATDGTILQLSLRNPGQVVQAGQVIAQIAPPSYSFLVKAQVNAVDINKVLKGSEVQMRVNGCPYTEYGTLNGTVQTISADTMAATSSSGGSGGATEPQTTDSKTASVYEVTIQPKGLFLSRGKSICKLKYGMDGRADIIIQKETVLEYVLKKSRLLTEL